MTGWRESESAGKTGVVQRRTPSPGRTDDLDTPARDHAVSPILRLYPALGNSHFRLFWLGMLPATLAWQMNVVAAPYAAFSLNGTATVLGFVSLAGGLPMLVLALAGGVVADRFPRRAVIVGTQSTLCASAATLAVLSLTGTLQVWHLISVSAVQGAAVAFNMPARQAYIAEVAWGPLLRNAVALNNAGVNFARIAGPALAGVLLATPFVGTTGVFMAMACMYAAVLVSLFRLPARPAPVRGKGASDAWGQMLEGLRYLRSSAVLLTLLGMGFIAAILGMPYQTLMTVFAERVFHAGAGGLGALMAASGAGAFGGSLTVAALSRASRPALLQVAFGVGFGLSLVGFALSPSLPVAVVFLIMVGFLSAAYSALNNTLIMGNAAPSFYGRVMSVYLLTFASMPLGAMPLAWLSDHISAPTTIAIAGALVAGAVAAVALTQPAYRRIR